MYKNVLIISDNKFLSEKFFEIIDKKNISGSIFSFSISPFSNKEDFKFYNNKIQVYDLRNHEHISYIKENFDLVFSIHCKQIFPIDLVNNIKCINIHPGYNPINRGWYPQVFSIIHDTPIGATIHEIDEKLDHGAIIDRQIVEKYSYDTSETLYNRILTKEIELLDKNLENILSNTYQVIHPESEGNLFLKKDFNDLLELDLDESTTVRKVIDKLRALTHGNYNNAYFIDALTGQKIYVGVTLSVAKK